MSGPMTRGYGFNQVVPYAYEVAGEQAVHALLDGIERDFGARNLEANKWYPREVLVRMFRLLADLGGEEDKVLARLSGCGRRIGDVNQTWLRLVLRVLTPALWSKKAHTYWQRDHSQGEFKVDGSDVANHRIVVHLLDVEGFDHVGPVCMGVLTQQFTAMGKKGIAVNQEGWSLASPGPRNIMFEVRWKD